MILLFLVSSRSDIGGIPAGWDKLAHVLAYSGLGMLSLRAFHGGLQRISAVRSLAGVLLTVAYGVLDEWVQGRVAGRHSSVWDWAADGVGALLAVGALGLWVALRNRRQALARGRVLEGEP